MNTELTAGSEHTDPVLERWLREEVVPVALRMRAHPELGIPADEVFEGIEALHARRLKSPPQSG